MSNILLTNVHALICIDHFGENCNEILCENIHANSSSRFDLDELNYVKKNFCGIVFSKMDEYNNYIKDHLSDNIITFLCGDISQIFEMIETIENKIIYVIKEFSYNYDASNILLTNIGQIPINICNMGVYFRNFFDNSKNYFDLINNEHNFQQLTQSNKPGEAFRKGIYLSKVVQLNDEMKFNILRCSTNLSGPTENFRATDELIISQVNNISKFFFAEETELNHVLAQIYENKVFMNGNKKIERKATIKAHSDKTKDMPENGLIAFCTFYKDYCEGMFKGNEYKKIKKSSNNLYDYFYNGKSYSVLTSLRFKIKDAVKDSSLAKTFTVTLYPNSLFVIPLSTNRLYTHEIVPSCMSATQIPTRLGYVIRCSKTKAIFKNNNIYLDEKGILTELKTMDDEERQLLKKLYFDENLSSEVINYGNFYSSMNEGDYKQPIF